MNLHLYKVVDFYDTENRGDLAVDNLRVMTEKDLRKEFDWAMHHNIFPLELLADYQRDPNYSKEDWEDFDNLKVGTIIDMFNDIGNYGGEHYYYIDETDVDIELNRKMVENWLDILNYWEDEIRDVAERFDSKYRMYKKYNNMIDEIYRLSKGV